MTVLGGRTMTVLEIIGIVFILCVIIFVVWGTTSTRLAKRMRDRRTIDVAVEASPNMVDFDKLLGEIPDDIGVIRVTRSVTEVVTFIRVPLLNEGFDVNGETYNINWGNMRNFTFNGKEHNIERFEWKAETETIKPPPSIQALKVGRK